MTATTSKNDFPKADIPKSDPPKVEFPKAPKVEAPKVDLPSFELPSTEEATARIRDLNERLMESSKNAGLVTLDAYEKALKSLVEFEEKVSSATQLDWVSALATTHAKFISDVSDSYTKAARDLLK